MEGRPGREELQRRHRLLHRPGQARRAGALRCVLHRRQPVHQRRLPGPLPEPAGAADAAVGRRDAHEEHRPGRHGELDLQLAVQPGAAAWRRWTTSATAGPAGTSSPASTRRSRRTSALDEHLDYATRYGRAQEFVEVARGLWDSYEDDAFPADVEARRLPRPEQAACPQPRRRALQGRRPAEPVPLQARAAGDLPVRRSPRTAATLAAPGRRGHLRARGVAGRRRQAYHADIKARAAAAGRDPDHVVIFVGGQPRRRRDRRGRPGPRAGDLRGRQRLRPQAGLPRPQPSAPTTSRQHDLDAPFPDLTHLTERGGRSGADLVQQARENGWTLRQTVEAVSAYRPGPFTGSPQTVPTPCSTGSQSRRRRRLQPRTSGSPRTLERFVERGRADPAGARRCSGAEYESDTLRGNLGLPFPVNRHAHERPLVTA